MVCTYTSCLMAFLTTARKLPIQLQFITWRFQKYLNQDQNKLVCLNLIFKKLYHGLLYVYQLFMHLTKYREIMLIVLFLETKSCLKNVSVLFATLFGYLQCTRLAQQGKQNKNLKQLYTRNRRRRARTHATKAQSLVLVCTWLVEEKMVTNLLLR